MCKRKTIIEERLFIPKDVKKPLLYHIALDIFVSSSDVRFFSSFTLFQDDDDIIVTIGKTKMVTDEKDLVVFYCHDVRRKFFFFYDTFVTIL